MRSQLSACVHCVHSSVCLGVSQGLILNVLFSSLALSTGSLGGNVEACPVFPEFISHLEVLGEAESVPTSLCFLSLFVFLSEST